MKFLHSGGPRVGDCELVKFCCANWSVANCLIHHSSIVS